MFAELKKIEAEWRARMHKALSFGGVNDYVEIPDSPSLNITKEITLAAWVNIKLPKIIGWFICKYRPYTGMRTYSLGLTNNELRLLIGNETDNAIDLRTPITTGLHFVVGTYRSGGGSNLFIDGELKATGSDVGDIATNDLAVLIGAGYAGDGTVRYYFNGLITQVSIYNRALSESEIKYLYHNPFDPIDPDHLVLWLNPAGIDVANSKWWDLSGKDNHGTIYGATEVKLVEDEVIVT